MRYTITKRVSKREKRAKRRAQESAFPGIPLVRWRPLTPVPLNPPSSRTQGWVATVTNTSAGTTVAQPEIPDDPNPVLIRGWRQYDHRISGDILRGMTGRCWMNATMQANCNVVWDTDAAEEHLLAGSCTCGIYVLKERPEGDLAPILAEVVGWGAYVEYERGWRCQYVRIERLFVPDTVAALRARYDCPVEFTPIETTEED